MTMFNILLIIAGILEYILLGINFKVGTFWGGKNHSDLRVLVRTTSRIPISVESSLLSLS